jgi:hypothetical protein
MNEKESALMTTAQPHNNALSVFSNHENFEYAQRMAKALSSSDLVPETYKNNVANTMIALELANRTGVSPFMVMQNVNVIKGRPSWSSTFIISVINSCGRFSQLRFRISGEGDDKGCIASATDIKTGDVLESPRVTIKMAKAEGWFSKAGSKWVTMPDLMMQYRSAAFFGRLYVSDILQGMQSVDEVQDFMDVSYEELPTGAPNPIADINAKLAKPAAAPAEPVAPEPEPTVSDDDPIM